MNADQRVGLTVGHRAGGLFPAEQCEVRNRQDHLGADEFPEAGRRLADADIQQLGKSVYFEIGQRHTVLRTLLRALSAGCGIEERAESGLVQGLAEKGRPELRGAFEISSWRLPTGVRSAF